MGLLGTPVKVEVATAREHTRAVLCGDLLAVGDATGAYASFVIGDAALTLKECEVEHGLLSVVLDSDGAELRSVYLFTHAGGSVSISKNVPIAASADRFAQRSPKQSENAW